MMRVRSAVVAAVLLVSVAACSASDGDSDATDGQSTTVDPALLECGETAPADGQWQLQDSDLSAATWTMPDGFVETFAYSEDRAVEFVETFWAAEPATDPVPRNVLAVVVYSGLDWTAQADACGRIPTSALDARLEAYNQDTGAEVVAPPTSSDVGGVPALMQELTFPEYSYRGFWIFGRSTLIHVYCQWTTEAQREGIMAGCDQLIGSMQVTDGA